MHAPLRFSHALSSGSLEPPSDLARDRFCRALRGRDRTTCQVRHPPKASLLLLGHEPKMEVRHALHQRQEIDSVGSRDNLERRDESFQDRTEFGTLSQRHLAKIQQMSSGFDDYRSRIGQLQRAVLYEKVLPFDDVAPRRGSFSWPWPSCFRQIKQSDR
jgi:hypothetical protein